VRHRPAPGGHFSTADKCPSLTCGAPCRSPAESLTLQPNKKIDGVVRCVRCFAPPAAPEAAVLLRPTRAARSVAHAASAATRRLPGSKSLSNRILLLAALAGAPLPPRVRLGRGCCAPQP
jgi:hypothetical protein